MKVSYRNHKPLQYLHEGKLWGLMPWLEVDSPYFNGHVKKFTTDWLAFKNEFSAEVNYITKPFYEALYESQESLMKLWKQIVSKDAGDLDIKGTYIDAHDVYMIDYDIRADREYHKVAFYMFDKKGAPLAMHIDYIGKNTQLHTWVSMGYANQYKLNSAEEIEKFVWHKIFRAMLYGMFKKYCDKIETKILPPKSRTKDFHCKYVNDTDIKITQLDSTWYTNLVKSDGFKVRAHPRLQPVKVKGEWTRRLIWINEFQKTGYTAPARKIAYNEHRATP